MKTITERLREKETEAKYFKVLMISIIWYKNDTLRWTVFNNINLKITPGLSTD